MDVSRNKQLGRPGVSARPLDPSHLLLPSDDEDDKGHWVVGNEEDADWCRWSYQVCLVGK